VGGALGKLAGPGAAAVAVLGALAIGFQKASAAAQFADDLVAMADKIGVGVEALQELRYAAEANDVPAQKLDDSLQALNATIGAIQTGVGGARAAKPFAALDITPEQLKNIGSADQLLPLLADKISQIGSTAAQVQIAKKLGIEELLPLLRQGSDGLGTLRQKARDLGIVMEDDLARKAADANEELRVAAEVAKMRTAVAFASLADEAAGAAGVFADLTIQVSGWIDAAEDWAQRLGRIGALLAEMGGFRPDFAAPKGFGGKIVGQAVGQAVPGPVRVAGRAVGALFGSLGDKADARALKNDIAAMMAGKPVDDAAFKAQFPKVTAPGGFTPQATGGGGGRPRATPKPKGKTAEQLQREAEQAAREALQRARAQEDALSGLDARELSAREAQVTTAEDRYLMARQRAANEAEEFDRDINRKRADKEIDEVQEKALRTAFTRVQIEEAANDQAELNRATEERIVAAREELFRMAADALGVEANMATTLAQRADVERRILALAQQEERERLEQQITRGEVLNPQAARYNLGTKQAGQRAGLAADQGREAEIERFGGRDARRDAEGVAAGILEQDSAAARFEAENARIAQLENDRTLTHEQAERARAQISAAYSDERLAGTQAFFGALAGLQESGNAKLRAIGKAAAIAQATIDGVLAVQKALASAPPPFNFAIAAAVGASAALNVAKIAGFEHGGYTGPGGRKQVAGVVHGGEFVIPKDLTAKYRDELEHLHRFGRLPGFEAGGFVMPRAPRLPDMGRIASATSAMHRRDSIMVDVTPSPLFDVRVRRANEPAIQEARVQAAMGGRMLAGSDLAQRQRKRIPSRAG
jgi:hypothetical protein